MFDSIKKFIPIFGTVLFTAIYGQSVQAQTNPQETLDRIEQYTNESEQNSIEQVINVNQLRDVSPTDWSYDALRSLTERYGCISGFPDGTFKGDRPMTRNEFAAGMNSCFQQIERSISQKQPDLTSVFFGNTRIFTEEDGSISTLYTERDSFDVELGTLGGRIDELESRTIQLEKRLFSPTTKLKGEAVFDISDEF